MTEKQALDYLLNRITAIRDAVVKQEARRQVGLPVRDLDIGWQLGQFVDEFEKILGRRSSELDALLASTSPDVP